mgnify:CR=1 FL=1
MARYKELVEQFKILTFGCLIAALALAAACTSTPAELVDVMDGLLSKADPYVDGMPEFTLPYAQVAPYLQPRIKALLGL